MDVTISRHDKHMTSCAWRHVHDVMYMTSCVWRHVHDVICHDVMCIVQSYLDWLPLWTELVDPCIVGSIRCAPFRGESSSATPCLPPWHCVILYKHIYHSLWVVSWVLTWVCAPPELHGLVFILQVIFDVPHFVVGRHQPPHVYLRALLDSI